MDPFKNKIILITGGTGSLGKQLVKILLNEHKPKIIRIFSRDELKQHELRLSQQDDRLRFLIGNIRDRKRLELAFKDVDLVFHTAALKQVPTCEYNPFEAIKTNILGAKNIIEAAMKSNVEKIMFTSTDKAVNPINLYGATKLCAEKLFVQANTYSAKDKTKFSCVRYGNVVGSRGSIIPVLKKQKKKGVCTLTDPRMTRFWITLPQAARFVLNCINLMKGGEIFVPKIPSMKITDLIQTIAPECKVKNIGIRPGEKIHEILVSENEARHTVEFEKFYVIEPEFPWWNLKGYQKIPISKQNFKYSSNTNTKWLTKDELIKLVKLL